MMRELDFGTLLPFIQHTLRWIDVVIFCSTDENADQGESLLLLLLLSGRAKCSVKEGWFAPFQ